MIIPKNVLMRTGGNQENCKVRFLSFPVFAVFAILQTCRRTDSLSKHTRFSRPVWYNLYETTCVLPFGGTMNGYERVCTTLERRQSDTLAFMPIIALPE